MKKRVMLISMLLCGAFVVAAVGAQPGTDGDPLVTKSYIDSVVYPYVQTASQFKVADVAANKSVILGAGAEIILRMGNCSVIASEKGGLSDVTMGFDLESGVLVQGNHLLIAPLGDGRGVFTATDCIFMIKGEYEIK